MKILHVFRAPVGGLFRHVRDLVRGQAEAGHSIGILCADDGGEVAENLLADTSRYCTLGMKRIPILRRPDFSDYSGIKTTCQFAHETGADVIHGHGAKGGLFARIAGSRLGVVSIYTPHGGSLNYKWNSLSGAVFLLTEKWLARKGSGLIFVCDYERRIFDKKVGIKHKPYAVIHNGLWPAEFTPAKPYEKASDFLFVGEMKGMKGVDVLIEAFHQIQALHPSTLAMVGDGPELEKYRSMVQEYGLERRITFLGRLPTAEALRHGHIMVIPSRAESFPYIVLETVAAELTLITTDVGGISEVIPKAQLLPAGNVSALAERMADALSSSETNQANARTFRTYVESKFSAQAMVAKVLQFVESLQALNKI